MRETAKHWLVAVAVAVVCGGVVAAVVSLRPQGAEGLDGHWATGNVGAFADAAKASGIESPSLYRWRASQALERGDVTASVRELFAATAIDDTFPGRSQLLEDLAVTQQSLGLTKTIFDSAFFRVAFLRAGRWSWWLFATAAWLLLLAAFARWYRPTLVTGRLAPFVTAAAALVIIAGAGLGLGQLTPPYAVLTGPGAVSLFRNAAAIQQPNDASGRLAELPTGTLVTLGDTEGDDTAVRLIEPFGGWIPANRSEPMQIGVKN